MDIPVGYRVICQVIFALGMNRKYSCIVVDDDPLTRKVIENFVERTADLELVVSCDSAIDASHQLRQHKVDILFLDVEMPDMTGLELLETLKDPPEVILVTSKEKYAVSAFNLDVTDYMVKPVEYKRFLKSLEKVTERLENQVDGEEGLVAGKLFVKVDHQLVGIEVNDIFMVEAMADYARIHTDSKRYTVYSSMKGIAKKLPADSFMRVHRSYIVNLASIDSIEDNTIVIHGNLIPVGVTYQKALMGKLNTL